MEVHGLCMPAETDGEGERERETRVWEAVYHLLCFTLRHSHSREPGVTETFRTIDNGEACGPVLRRHSPEQSKANQGKAKDTADADEE